ncbi:zinc C3HC4 type RING finger domain-containing protein, putative [Babesia ovis]|uniref:Zinc C3HC4 type RING finger domain-containing protein, putative n=1 Tax=Babesia ovis TaxID=5869 RepID=A0A9W5TC76_BABOV|nr:zinc C3HC4 type RING finger domain-containing protein, putative [Babesia ovis]
MSTCGPERRNADDTLIHTASMRSDTASEPQETAAESNVMDASADPDTLVQNGDSTAFSLMHYMNAPPLRNFVGDPIGNQEDRETQRVIANRNFLIRVIIYANLLAAMLFSGLLIWSIFIFEIRLYEWQRSPSKVLIFFWLMRMLLRIALNVWFIRYHYQRLQAPSIVGYCAKAYDIGSWLWLLFAIYYTILNPRESLSTFSCKLCFFLIWVTIACYISPILTYTLLCITVYPIIYLLVRWRQNGSLSPGLPKKFIQQMDVMRFDAVLARIQRGETKPRRMSKTGSGLGTKRPSNTVVTMDGTDTNEASPPKNTDSPGQSFNDFTVSDRLCAICIMEIEDNEKIFVMPCDIRHFFHRECLKKWFKRSRICPICRVDIGNLSDMRKSVDNG